LAIFRAACRIGNRRRLSKARRFHDANQAHFTYAEGIAQRWISAESAQNPNRQRPCMYAPNCPPTPEPLKAMNRTER
jgi:hypothetical protein